MEVLGAVSTVVGLVDVIEKRLVEFRVRLDRVRQHPDQYTTLVATHDRICDKLKQLHASLSETSSEETVNDIKLFQTLVDAAHSELSELGEYFDVSSVEHASQTLSSARRRKRITSALSKFKAKGKAIQRTTRNEETLSSIQGHLDCAWRVLNEIRLLRIEEGVTAITAGEHDVFVSSVVVRPNPENLVLDFESKDENGTAVTCEGKLKQALLGGEGSCIGVIDGNVAGAIGGGGMGKSCAARALASLQKVRDIFPEGIYEISLGMNAGELTLKKELCNCIERSGGVRLAKEMISERNMQEVFRKAEGWFADRKVLFIVDDVWENEEITRNLFFSLKRLLGFGGSRLVFTSRTSALNSISRSAVEFGLRGPFSSTSKQMLLEHAQLNEEDPKVRTNTATLRNLLQLCGGLPVALAVAGQLVREHGSEFDDPFGEVMSRIKCDAGEVQKYGVAGYGALADLLDTAVQFCERRHGQHWGRKTGKTFDDIVASLCVFKKQQFAPVSMLRRLWGLENDVSSRDLLKILKDVGLVKEEVVHEEHGQVVGIRLHDLVHSHFETKAEGRREAFHAELLSRYVENDTEAKYRAWWEVDGQEDKYLYLNLFTHLCMANLKWEALRLSLDPRWTLKQFRLNGEAQVYQDHAWVLNFLSTLKGIGRETLVAKIPEAIGLISDALNLAEPYVIRNDREVWFQLYGRLLGLENLFVRKYLHSIQQHAERPWFRATGRCVSQAGGLIKRIWNLDRAEFMILHTWLGQDDMVYVLGKVEFSETEEYEVWRLERRGQSDQKRIWAVTIQQRVMHSFISHDGSKLGLVTGDGQLEVWNIEKGKRWSSQQNMQDGSGVGTFSADGTMLAFVSNGTLIMIWKTVGDNSEEICTLRNESVVSSVCWSGDGKSVAVGCKDGHVMLWDLESRSVNHEFDIGRGNEIGNLAWSSNGRLLATSVAKKGMGVWDVTFRRGKLPVQVFHSQSVCGHMEWSPDGSYLAITTMYTDGKRASGVMTVWEMHKAPAMKTCVVKCMDRIVCMNWSEDGRKLVACDQSKTVRLAEPLAVDAKGAISDTDVRKWTHARLGMNGTMLATLGARGVRLWRQHGGQGTEGIEYRGYKDLSSKDVKAGMWTYSLVWAADGEVLAAVFAYNPTVVIWNVRTRELLSFLPLPHFTCGVLNKDGSVFAACSYNQLVVWRTREEEPQRSDRKKEFENLESLALSHDGRILCAVKAYLKGILVWDVADFRRRAWVDCKRKVRALSFNEQNDVVIEWLMDDNDMTNAFVEQFSVWRWQSGDGVIEALPLKRRSCLVGQRRFFDAQRRCLATFEDDFVQWDYSEQSGVLAMLTEDGRLVTCFLETT